jgi:prevent-host-death family protein
VTKEHTIADARANLAELVREAESGRPVELTRRGKRVAVLVSTREYERLVGQPRRFSAAWDAFRKEVDLPSLGIEPEEIFAGVRDACPGRDTDLER